MTSVIAAAVAAAGLVACGSSEPSLSQVERVAKRTLGTTHVRCNRDAPPHEYRCDWTRGGTAILPDDGGTAILRTDGNRIWLVDAGT